MLLALMILCLVYMACMLLRASLALSYVKALPANHDNVLLENVLTIAQPILSGDPLLEMRLQANITQLQDQCFLWLIDEEDAEANRIVEKLRAENPAVNLQIEIYPSCPDKKNPKMWKLQHAAQIASTPFFCVLDDDTTLSQKSAARLLSAASSHTVATGLPCYQDAGDIASGLLAQFVNNNAIFTYMGTSRLLPAMTLNGMGYVMRRETLGGINHFTPILHELTDDLALATLVLQQGGDIHQSDSPLCVQTGVKNIKHYMQLMHRWYVFTFLLLKRQSIKVQLLIFLLHGLPSLILMTIFVLTMVIATPFSVIIFATLLLIRLGVLTRILCRFYGAGFHRPFLSIVSELMQPIHLVHALMCRTIRWRTHLYHVRDTNDFSEV